MEMLSIEKELQENSYPGRGIIIGRSKDGTKAVTAYFIMGQGGKRLSAAGLKEEVDMAAAQMKEHLEAAKPKTKTYLGEYFPEDSGKAE